jgi:molybdate transport system regulatory protein
MNSTNGMLTRKKNTLSGKVWIEHEGKPLIGKGGAEILEGIAKEKSISKAAETLGMSYRYVWNYLQKIEKTIGEPIVETFKGGKSGGGGAKLTETGKSLLAEYTRLEGCLSEFLTETKTMGGERFEIKRKKPPQRKSDRS